MNPMDAFETRCVRIAASRWPQDVRDEQAAEWAAELHALRHDGSVGPWRRAWQRLSFVVSLATLPPYKDRRESNFLMPRLNLLGRRCAMFMAVGILCAIVQAAPGMVRRAPLQGYAADILAALAVLATVVALAALGHRLGARRPFAVNPESRLDRPATAAVAAVSIGVVLALLIGRYGDGTVIEWLVFPLWLFAFIPLTTHVMRLAATGRTRAAWIWAVGGGLLLCELLTIPLGIGYAVHSGTPLSHVDPSGAPLWFVSALTGEYGEWFAHGMLSTEPQDLTAIGLATALPALLPATAFLLTYLRRSARQPWPAPIPDKATTKHPAPAVPPLRKYTGLTICALALIGWSALTVYLTPIADQVGHDAPMAWVRDLRMAAILLAAVALSWSLLGQFGVLLPATALGIGMLIIDIAADRWHLTGTGMFLLLAAAAGALTVGIWWAATTLNKTPPPAPTRRKNLTYLAILTAFCAPAPQWQANALTQGYESEGVDSPIALPIATTALMITLTVIALTTANAARNRPLSPTALTTASIVPLTLISGAGLLTWTGIPAIPDGTGGSLGLTLVVYTFALITWESKPSPTRALTWTGLALAGLPLGIAIAYVEAIISGTLGSLLLSLHSSYGAELIVGSPVVMAGVLPIAAIAATIATRTIEPHPSPSTTSPSLATLA